MEREVRGMEREVGLWGMLWCVLASLQDLMLSRVATHTNCEYW